MRGGNFHKVQFTLLGLIQGLLDRHHAQLPAVFVNQADLGDAYSFVSPVVFGYALTSPG